MSVTLKMSSGSGDVSVSAAAFEAEYNEALIHQVVVAYQAGGRAGTVAQKTRSQVNGGGAKPWRQKGTGRARAGTIRSPIFRGGGKVFAATPRDYSQKVNRKMYRAAIRSILSELNRQERLIVIEDFQMDKPKTKELNEKLAKINVSNALLVLSEDKDFNVALSARNLKSVEVCGESEINPVNLISYDQVVVTKSAIEKIDEVLK